MRGERSRPRWREPVLIAAAVVLAVAVAAVGVIAVDWMAQPVAHAPVDGDGVPTALPNGADLPAVDPALAAALDRPVVMVAALDDPLGELSRCGQEHEWEYAPTLRASVITPEGLTVSIRGEERATEALVHVTCFAQWQGRSWKTWAAWTAEAPDATEPLGAVAPICCRAGDLALRGHETLAPEGSRWLVQDRGAYWLAYPVDDGGLVHPVWPVGGGADDRPRTVYLDAAGAELAATPAPETPAGAAPDAPGAAGPGPAEAQEADVPG